MNVGVLFSGGKDSVYASYLAKKQGHNLVCLITVISDNPESYMFHTPSITKVKKQAEMIKIPLLTQKTFGVKEDELIDLKDVILKAKNRYNVNGIVTGTVESAYQASRIQKICDDLNIDCFNPLWQKNQIELLNEMIKSNFEIIITGVFAYPLTKEWLGRKIDNNFINEVKKLLDQYKINPAGEGGEFESFVLNCPLFSKKLEVVDKKILGKQNSWSMEIVVK